MKQSISSKGTRGLLFFLYHAGSYRGLNTELKQNHFIILPPLHVCPVGGDLQHVMEDGAPGRQADGGDVVRAVTIVDILEKEAGS